MKLSCVPYRLKRCVNSCTLASPSNFSGVRVVISTVAPSELPGYSAEYGPYSTSMRSISALLTSDQRGGKLKSDPSRLDSSRPSA
ncbi:hypothetical protein D3C72_1654740 [compost metagenome]